MISVDANDFCRVINEKANIEILIQMIVGLQQEVNLLKAENEHLKSELSKLKTKKTSRNSSIPPSKDENRPNKSQSLREKSNKPVGGQKGHEPKTLEMTQTPDKILEHIPSYCEHCGNDLNGLKFEYIGRRQVIELPPIKPITTEHRVYKITCQCGHETVSAFPANVKSSVSYDCNIEGLIGYFHSRQYIPFARLQELFRDIFNLPISEGGLHYLLERLTTKSLPAYEMIRHAVLKSPVIGSDETGIKINGKLNWFWTWQNKLYTLISVSKNRGAETIFQNCGQEAKHSILVHDCWKPHFKTTVAGHQLCTAHLLRELNYLQEKDKIDWPKNVQELLMKAIELKKKMEPGDYNQYHEERKKLEDELTEILNIGIDEKCKETITFQKRLIKYKPYIFTFLYHPKVPPDNNASERAIRNVKVKQKVSGQFKSDQGANKFAILRSITDTAIKNGQNVLAALITIANFDLQTD